MLLLINGQYYYTGCLVGGFASIVIISIVVITILIKTIKTLSTVSEMLLTELSLG